MVSRTLDEYFGTEAYAVPFLAACEHFVLDLDRRHRQICSAVDTPSIYASLTKWYASRLVETARFVLHLAYSRSGLTYSVWCEPFRQLDALRNPWREICTEFPVLLRWLATIDHNTRAAVEEMFRRLDVDRDSLEATHSIPRSAKVSAIEPGLSDPHRGGRTVMRLTFRDGSTVMYKPKPLDIEAAFSELARVHGGILGLIPLKVLIRPGYGWVEDAGHESRQGYRLQNPDSIGRAAACFWLLNATDLHFENVRPSPKGVYALDVETLMLPPAVSGYSDHEPRWRHHSVNTTLLFTASVGAGGRFLNISGFNPSPNLSLPSGQVQFRIVGDVVKMEVLPSQRQSQSVQHAPPAPHAPDVVAEIVRAFKTVITESGRAIIEHFVQTLDASCTLRFVFRDTYFYGRLLDRMRQPRFMRDGALLSLDLLLLHGGVPGNSAQDSRLHTVVADEIFQLLSGDVPYFSFEAGGFDLHTSGAKINHVFATSAKSHALNKLRDLEESDIAEQTALLAISFDAYIDKRDDSSVLDAGAGRNAPRGRPSTPLLPALGILSNNIIASAFRPAKTPARWLSLFGDISGEQLRVDVGDRGFFGGSWGIIMALQAVENALSGHHDTSVLRGFLEGQASLWETCMGQQDTGSPLAAPDSIGFSGTGGEVFAHSILMSLAPRRWGFLRHHIGGHLRGSEEAVSTDRWLDVIGGSAGFILGCEQLLKFGVAPEHATAAAKAQQVAASHLIEKAMEWEGGLAWKVPRERVPLLGFAHGWAGIVAALATAGRRATSNTQRSAIQSCLRQAAIYPHVSFESCRSWKDYRQASPRDETLNRSWCHGVPGFLRGMLEVQKYWTPEVGAEVDATIKKVRVGTSSDAYRFCCGEMGNLDFLLDYSKAACVTDPAPETASDFLQSAQGILAFANNQGIRNRDYPELSFPGLFQGQAGLAYCVARVLLPDLPSLSGHHMARVLGGHPNPATSGHLKTGHHRRAEA
jgi:type 2 lantibiotic biosynthesis protein LanM